jgi:hypothetical protein
MTKEEVQHITQEYIFHAQQVLEHAEKLADRWRKAWGNTSYNCTGQVRLDFRDKVICFQPFCSDGVIPFFNSKPYPYCRISFNYFFDDSTLERDALLWYQQAEEERIEPYKRERELENTPEVQEWKRIQSAKNPYNFIRL